MYNFSLLYSSEAEDEKLVIFEKQIFDCPRVLQHQNIHHIASRVLLCTQDCEVSKGDVESFFGMITMLIG